MHFLPFSCADSLINAINTYKSQELFYGNTEESWQTREILEVKLQRNTSLCFQVV